jgi:hypothetical protein
MLHEPLCVTFYLDKTITINFGSYFFTDNEQNGKQKKAVTSY